MTYDYDDDMGAVESFVVMIGNHCPQFGIPSQPWLIEGMRCVARIIDCRDSPPWLVRDAEWALYDSIDRLIHDPDYLDAIGMEPAHPRWPVGDERMLQILAFLQQHAPEGLPTHAELLAEQRYHARGVKLVWSGSMEEG